MPAEVLARLAAARRVGFRVDGVGAGEGSVAAVRAGDALVLTAEGTWAPDGRPVRWRAVSRWRAEGEALAVAWVRPVEWARVLLDRQPGGGWAGRAPHVCGDDRYAAALRIDGEGAEVAWTIWGPHKSTRVVLRYS